MSTRQERLHFFDTVDRGSKRANVVEVEHGQLSATGYFLSATSCMRSEACLCRPRVVTGQSPIFQLPLVLIFTRQASLARQAFLMTPLHGARSKTGKNAYALYYM